MSLILLGIKASIGPTYASYVSIFELFNLLGSITIMTKFKYWASGYLIGYLFAITILSYIGLAESWLVVLYAIVGIPIIILRFFGKVADFLDNL